MPGTSNARFALLPGMTMAWNQNIRKNKKGNTHGV
jgi:hypothetical protein